MLILSSSVLPAFPACLLVGDRNRPLRRSPRSIDRSALVCSLPTASQKPLFALLIQHAVVVALSSRPKTEGVCLLKDGRREVVGVLGSARQLPQAE